MDRREFLCPGYAETTFLFDREEIMSSRARIVVVLLAAIVAAGCQSGAGNGDLTEDEQKKLMWVAQENVASFGAPPLIPAEHEFEIGSDVSAFENGGDVCLDCHADDSEDDAPQTSHPERHNCLQCHVPQAAETAAGDDFMVDNSFVKYDPGAGK